MSTIQTEIFRITPGCYLRIAAFGVISKVTICLSIIALICGIGAIFDIRWAFMFLILVFLIIPFIVFHIYFMKLLTTEAQKMLSPKSCSIAPDNCIIITYHSADEEHKPLPEEKINWTNIKSIRASRKLIIISLNDNPTPLIIPINAFNNTNQALNLITPETY